MLTLRAIKHNIVWTIHAWRIGYLRPSLWESKEYLRLVDKYKSS